MWKELKELIKTRLGADSHPRRTGVPRFRGQFERLETRTVLSATIGAMAVDFEAGTIAIAVWESPPQFPEPPLFAAFQSPGQFIQRFADNHYGGRNEFGAAFNAGPGLFKHFGDSNRDFPVQLIGHRFGPEGFIAPPSTDVEAVGHNKSENQNNNPVFAQADSGGDGDTNPTFPNTSKLNDRSRFDNVFDRFVRDFRPPAPLAIAASLYSATDTANQPGLQTRPTFGAHDAAFDEYSPESLLLASNLDDDADQAELGFGEDKRDADEKATDSTDESALALVGGDAAESLDALEREQAAIDAVLAELHDLNLCQDEQGTDTAQSHGQSKSNRPQESAEDGLPTDGREIVDANFSQAAGGMVLLEPTGDANSSAYDLTAVFTGKFARPHDVALGLEATVGLQQAFDVGSNERFESAGARAPVAQPSAASAQPSVSAENAPAKKSEQPS
jgi:hypothetical protein